MSKRGSKPAGLVPIEKVAAPLSADGLAAILATADRPRTDGRGVESHTTAQRRGRLDAVIAGLLFMGGLRRSEVAAWTDPSAALGYTDVTDAKRDGARACFSHRDCSNESYLENESRRHPADQDPEAARRPLEGFRGCSGRAAPEARRF